MSRTSCCGFVLTFTALLAGSSVSQVHAAESGAFAEELKALPQAPITTPKPWVPYAIETRMGAQWCPQDTHEDALPARAVDGGFVKNPCLGLLPQHLAEVLLAIPSTDIFISPELRASLLKQPQNYRAVAGPGARPDFLANIDYLEGITLRSFEGTTAADSVYLVFGPFHCIDNEPNTPSEGEYLIETPACHSALPDLRLYQWTTAGVLSDVTARYLPAPPLTPAEQAAIGDHRPQLQLTQLSDVPAMGWTALLKSRYAAGGHDDYEPIDMPADIPEHHRLNGALLLGSVVWDGKGFRREP